ncbi:MAG: hypothetical protein AVDCRST_MAG22-3219, partial [uncultured Rubrobacteraceae bacterium]
AGEDGGAWPHRRGLECERPQRDPGGRTCPGHCPRRRDGRGAGGM